MMLSLVVFTPLLGALLLALLPREPVAGVRRAAFLFSLIPLVASLFVLRAFQAGQPDFQLVERAAWIPAFGVSYHFAVDGVSLILVLLTTVLTPIVVQSCSPSVADKSFFNRTIFIVPSLICTHSWQNTM